MQLAIILSCVAQITLGGGYKRNQNNGYVLPLRNKKGYLKFYKCLEIY
jgi:hypothetical protein